MLQERDQQLATKKGALSLQDSGQLNTLWFPREGSKDRDWGVSYWYSLPPAQSPSGLPAGKANYKSSLPNKKSMTCNDRPMERETKERLP